MSNVKKKPTNILVLAQLGILIALQAVLAFTPLGFIIIPPLPAVTLMHIPVIIGAVLLGPFYGGTLGLSFGIMAMIRATTSGSPIDMLFSPFTSPNPVASIVMCIVTRILLGVIAGYLFIWLKKLKWCKSDFAAIPITSAVATICHTVMVLGCLWAFFDQLALKDVFMSVIAINGLLEIAAAMVITTAVCKPLLKVFLKYRKVKA